MHININVYRLSKNTIKSFFMVTAAMLQLIASIRSGFKSCYNNFDINKYTLK